MFDSMSEVVHNCTPYYLSTYSKAASSVHF